MFVRPSDQSCFAVIRAIVGDENIGAIVAGQEVVVSVRVLLIAERSDSRLATGACDERDSALRKLHPARCYLWGVCPILIPPLSPLQHMQPWMNCSAEGPQGAAAGYCALRL